MKTFCFVVVLAFVVAMTGTVDAAPEDYGEWSLVGQGNISYSNSALIRLSTPQPDLFVTASVHQDGASSAQLMHFSTDQGVTWEPMFRVEAGSGFCGIYKFIHMVLDVHFFDAARGVRGGFGAWDQCFDMLPEPICLACIFFNGTEAYTTEDGGETWQPSKLIGTPTNGSFSVIQMLDDQVGYAGGQYGTLALTTDGGKTWTHQGNPDPAMDEWEVNVEDVFFLDDVTGYAATGMYDDYFYDPYLTDAETPQQIVDWMLHKARLLRDPFYRRDFRESAGGSKGAYGKILKTTDGAQTWQVLYEDQARMFYRVRFLDEQTGFAISESFRHTAPWYVLMRTTDGGETWDMADLPGWGEIPGAIGPYALYDVKFASDKLGFLLVGAPSVPYYRTTIFYTVDGGMTWNLDDFSDGWWDPIDIEFVGRDAYVVGQAFMTMKYAGVDSTPVADAGEDQTVDLGATVTLDGSGSYDLDGDPLIYTWAQTDGAAETLDDASAVDPTFTAGEVGAYTFALVVADAEHDSEPDTVTVTVVEPAEDDDDTAPIDDDNDTDDDDDDDDAAVTGDDDDDDNGSCGC